MVASTSRRWLLLVSLLLLSGGCAPAFQRRAQNLTVLPPRIVSLPALTMATELSFNDNYTPQDQWADAMAKALDPQIQRWVTGNRGHSFVDEGATVPAVYPAFRRWTSVALVEIAAQMLGRADFKLYSVDKWGVNRDLTRVRERLDADFALVTLFRDTRRTGGHVVAAVLTGQHYYFLQVGIACLVDLQSGQMVWCNALADRWADLSVPENATKAVGDLLTDLYYPSLAAANVKPAGARK